MANTPIPANLVNTARTASGYAASSTATPNNSTTVVTWTLPGWPNQPLVNSTQSFSTQLGQIFADFVSGQIVEAPGVVQSGQQTYSLRAGTPPID